MTTKYVTGQPEVGRIWLPEAKASYPTGGKCRPIHSGVVVASQYRLWGTAHGIWKFEDDPNHADGAEWLEGKLAPYRGEVNPVYFERQMGWVSVTHNDRVNDGAGIQVNRLFGTVGTPSTAGVIINIALGSSAIPTGGTTITKTATDSSLGANAAAGTTLEFVTLGLSRAAGTPTNFVAATTLDGTCSVDIAKTAAVGTVFTATGTAEVNASGLFDHVTPASSNLYCEDNFSAEASMVNTDTLAITWTVTF